MPNNNFKSPYDPLSDKDLERGYWFVTHKVFLSRIAYSIFIAFDLIIILFCAYKLINYYTFENYAYENFLAENAADQLNYTSINEVIKPSDLQLGSVKILDSGQSDNKKYNLMAEIYNPNDKFRIDFNYQFIYNETSLAQYADYLLPGQKKIIADFSSVIKDGAAIAEVRLNNVNYNRISKEYPSPLDFMAERMDFKIKNIELIPLNLKQDISKIKFNLANDTVYNYWEINLYILLYKDGGIIGADKIAINKINSGETRPVEINWYEYLPPSIKVSVISDVDIFDPQVYMGYKGVQKGLLP
ncbi:MAG: hypothetical protein V1860_04145 [bacterium]